MYGSRGVNPGRMKKVIVTRKSKIKEMMRDQKHKTRFNFIAVEGYIYLGERILN